MKKTTIAMAGCLALGTGAADAQTSLSLLGVLDATLAVGKGNVANRTQLGNSGYSGARIGVRGTEDLGSGQFAAFWLEAGVANDDGQGSGTNAGNQPVGAAVAGRQGLTFNRRSTVSLGGNWGELRVGRDYTPQFWNLSVFDPFLTNGVGLTQTLNGTNGLVLIGVPTSIRASNSIGYHLPPDSGGLYGQVMVYLGENPSNAGTTKKDGSGSGARLGYSSGPFNVAIALSRTEYASGNATQNNIGAQWNFGSARLMGQLGRDKLGSVEGRSWLLGALISAGAAGEVRVSYSRYRAESAAGLDASTRKVSVGYVHNLSKRTALYATYARLNNNGGSSQSLNGSGTSAGMASSGWDFGVRHSF